MQKRTRLSLIFLFFAMVVGFTPALQAQTATEIVDKDNQLTHLFGGLNNTSFDQAFHCGTPVSFFVRMGQEKLHCEPGGLCEGTNGSPEIADTDFQAEDCSADAVAIYSTHGHELHATSSDYTSASNSVAKILIQSIGLFYEHIEKVSVDQVVFPMAKNLIENGQMKNLMLTTLMLSIYPDKTKNESQGLMISLDLTRSGLDQLMCISETDPCDSKTDYVMKRKGLVHAPY